MRGDIHQGKVVLRIPLLVGFGLVCLWANQMPGFLILSISRTNQLLPLSIVNIFYLFPCIFFLSKIARFHLVMICFFLLFHKCQCCPHIETSQLICFANQLTGFYMALTLAFIVLIGFSMTNSRERKWIRLYPFHRKRYSIWKKLLRLD